MTSGSMPVTAHERSARRGVRPRSRAFGARISTTAAAPSLMPEALPAVTRAALLEGGPAAGQLLQRGRARMLVRANGSFARCASIGRSRRRSGPAAIAAAARCWLRRAKRPGSRETSVLLRDVLGRDAHLVPAERIGQQR